MAGRTCFHCKEWIEEGAPHDCWTTTEEALTRDLSDDLREAWERLRETASELGEQRIYLELCIFLGRTLKAPQVRRVLKASKSKAAHIIQIRHRDEVEPPITDWLREAYELPDVLAAKAAKKKNL